MRKSFELDMFIAISILKLWSSHTSTRQRYLLGSRLPSVKLDWLRGSSVALLGALLRNQRGTGKSKNTPVTNCTTIPKTMEKLRLKNGILLTMNPAEQTGWMIVSRFFVSCRFWSTRKRRRFFWGHPHIHTWKYFWIFIYENIVLSLLSEHLAICRVRLYMCNVYGKL